ncbi:NUDIX domain-containing protein [Streptomyces mutabilis]|uniref:NUDIX domain-containing protein n=1 Tax=Streptomyces mutabilis TaxID=67332 RepID=UPI0034DEC55F
MDAGSSAHAQALLELFEETGIPAAELTDFRPGPILELPDACGDCWRVHTFRAGTTRRKLQLNWEHDTYRWVRPQDLPRFDGQVPWLRDVVATTAA